MKRFILIQIIQAAMVLAIVVTSFSHIDHDVALPHGDKRGTLAFTTAYDVDVTSISANNFDLAHQYGNTEKGQNILPYSLQSQKLIRTSIFDLERIVLLSMTLIWFVHSAYVSGLSPFWRPSIPIAHRKLVI